MKKSLIVVMAALVFGVGAAGTDRLRYASSVFSLSDQVTAREAPRARAAEYPPCVRGVREDRCIQLYERGVRRAYREWLAGSGGRAGGALPRRTVVNYPVCRSRSDDNCIQVSRRTRTARAERAERAERAAARRVTRRDRARALRAGATTRRPVTRQAPPRVQTPPPTRRRTPPPVGQQTPGI